MEESDEEYVPTEYILKDLRSKFDGIIRLCEDIPPYIERVYPIQESEDEFGIFHKIVELLTRLKDLSISQLSRSTVDELMVASRELLRDLDELRSTVLENRPDFQSISNLLFALQKHFHRLLIILQPWLSFLLMQKASIFDAEAVERKIDELQKEQQTAINSLNNSVQSAVAKANEATASIQKKDAIAIEALGDIGVSRHAKEFEIVKDEHKKYAVRWLWASLILILLTAVIAFLLYVLVEIDNTWNSPKNAHEILFKIAILTTLFYLISQSVKNYKINKHLEVVNRHRATALRTFKTFVENAGENKDVKMAILQETTKAIFEPVNTGYVEKDDDGPNNRIIDVVNVVRGK